MDAGKAAAIAAYRNQLNLLQQARESTSASMGESASAGSSFANMLGNALQESANTVRQSDTLETKAMTGKVDLTDLVTAVTNAELTLNTVVTVRDRVISAYQDIIRMAI